MMFSSHRDHGLSPISSVAFFLGSRFVTPAVYLAAFAPASILSLEAHETGVADYVTAM